MCSWAVQMGSAVDHFLLKTMSVVSEEKKSLALENYLHPVFIAVWKALCGLLETDGFV